MCIINICLDRKMSKELFKSNVKRINTNGKQVFENINYPTNHERLPDWQRLKRMVPSGGMDMASGALSHTSGGTVVACSLME